MPGMGRTQEIALLQQASQPQQHPQKKYQQINDNMHKSMDIKFTGDADKDFLAAMIPHHQGAVEMAEVVLQHGKNPKIRQLAQEIITMQKKEIAEMKQLLKDSK